MFAVTTKKQPFVRKPLDYHFHFPRTFFIPVNYALFTHNTRTIDAQYTHYSYDLDAFHSYHRYCLIIYKTNESVVRHSRCLILIVILFLFYILDKTDRLTVSAIVTTQIRSACIKVETDYVIARFLSGRPIPTKCLHIVHI